MFYSSEILTDKRYAMSTVWRAGNTASGARSTGLRRKAIMEVNLEHACGTIKDPPGAPIALRLQGTLLYGTARIFQEKCRFVLNDSERIQRAMLKLCGSFGDNKLDHNAGKAKSVQIILPNDPSFDLDFLQLPPFDFDAPDDVSLLSQTRQASWTSMSLKSRSSVNSQLPQLALDADSSGHRSYAGAGGFGYSASGASNMLDSPTPFARHLGFTDDDNMSVDIGLFIDENGNIIEEEAQSEPLLPVMPATSAAKGKAPMAEPMILDDDEEMVLPAVVMPAAIAGPNTAKPNAAQLPETVSSSPKSTSVTIVPSKMARQKGHNKTTFVDEITQIPLSEYFGCVTNYAHNMMRAAGRKTRARTVRRANNVGSSREEAYEFTFGRGVFAVAQELGKRHAEHPLVEMFAGESLEEAFYGPLQRTKRARLGDAAPSTPINRVNRAGAVGNSKDLAEEQEIELGRQPGSALSDNPSLGLNRNSSLPPGSSVHGSVKGSVKRGASMSRILPGTEAGPSTARHSSPNFIERNSDDGMELSAIPPSLSVNPALPSVDSPSPPGLAPDDGNDPGKIGEEMRDTSAFLELVQTRISEHGLRKRGRKGYRWIAFDDVVTPFKTYKPAVVASFMSLLSLATMQQLCIQQEDVDGNTIAREILIGMKKGKFGEPKNSTPPGVAENDLKSQEDLMSGHVFPDPIDVDDGYYAGGDGVDADLLAF